MSTVVTKREGILFCLVGPSAGGKTSLGAYLLEKYPKSISLSISATTRPPRENEVQGEDYLFLDESAFKQKIDAGEFFEWAIVHGNYYGTLKETVDSAVRSGKDLLLDIDLQGIRSFQEAYPDHTVVSFILPPTRKALVSRMQARSATSEEELTRRLETANREYQELRELAAQGLIEYFIVNDEIEQSRRQISAVYEAEQLRMQRILNETVDSICTIELKEDT